MSGLAGDHLDSSLKRPFSMPFLQIKNSDTSPRGVSNPFAIYRNMAFANTPKRGGYDFINCGQVWTFDTPYKRLGIVANSNHWQSRSHADDNPKHDQQEPHFIRAEAVNSTKNPSLSFIFLPFTFILFSTSFFRISGCTYSQSIPLATVNRSGTGLRSY